MNHNNAWKEDFETRSLSNLSRGASVAQITFRNAKYQKANKNNTSLVNWLPFLVGGMTVTSLPCLQTLANCFEIENIAQIKYGFFYHHKSCA